MNSLFLGIGTNLGNRVENIARAIALIENRTGTINIASSLYETEPWGFHASNQFLNQVVKIKTELDPVKILDHILGIEESLGRIRSEKQYVSRIIDIDILLYNDQVINIKDLVVPHPHMHERRFVLVPLCELTPELVHPVLKKTMSSLLRLCDDRSKVELYTGEK